MTDVIAIDGPSGSGKSSTSRGVASRLGFAYLDTGAMYRAMTWALLQRGVDVHDPAAVAAAAREVVLTSGTDPAAPTIAADGVDVSEPIRGDEVTSAVSPVATVPEVREQLVALQRDAIARATGGIVVEGRDIGTVVAPDASLKIYLVADPVARAQRRAAELGVEDAEAMREALARRDAIDSNRAASPLAQADDAVVVDGTDLTLDEVIDRIVGLATASA
ncbi:cytidylate kinase [Aeromicrobium flavum]|uniref:Cytidylate kinase n=1 Tax=Aeromicrobium flavum TaxID=416568 RepID=A0A512HWQ1_9ACTN|nr:(d)CMP kinase [Aeromicrobium flavum]GEO89873.1 cytidylate kinase [Aeromicrobium flavum]